VEEANDNLKEAISLYLEGIEANQNQLPMTINLKRNLAISLL